MSDALQYLQSSCPGKRSILIEMSVDGITLRAWIDANGSLYWGGKIVGAQSNKLDHLEDRRGLNGEVLRFYRLPNGWIVREVTKFGWGVWWDVVLTLEERRCGGVY